MTRQNHDTLADDAINTLLQTGLSDGLPRIAEMIFNAAMLLERASHLQAGPYERVEGRTGLANGFKPRFPCRLAVGKLDLALPQVRAAPSPSALRFSNADRAPNAPSKPPSPRCTSKALPPAESPW